MAGSWHLPAGPVADLPLLVRGGSQHDQGKDDRAGLTARRMEVEEAKGWQYMKEMRDRSETRWSEQSGVAGR